LKLPIIGILSGVVLATSTSVCFVPSASAAQLWNWSYSGGFWGSLGGSGTFTTDDGPDPFTVTGITGTAEGQQITALLPPGAFYGNDNLLFSAFPQLDFLGIAFTTTNNKSHLLFWLGDECLVSQVHTLCYAMFAPASFVDYDFVDFSASLVAIIPEPSSLFGFIILGGLMLGGNARKARK
jgi:hypothetical protein